LRIDVPPAAGHAQHDESALENRETLIDVVIDDAIVEDRLRQASVDQLRAEGLPCADELRDRVFLELPALFFGKGSGDDGAGRRGVDFGDVVLFLRLR
jgi:hypothetical protein